VGGGNYPVTPPWLLACNEVYFDAENCAYQHGIDFVIKKENLFGTDG